MPPKQVRHRSWDLTFDALQGSEIEGSPQNLNHAPSPEAIGGTHSAHSLADCLPVVPVRFAHPIGSSAGTAFQGKSRLGGS